MPAFAPTVSRRAIFGAPALLVSSRATAAAFSPEAFGAKGDGASNDSRAFAALGRAVTRAGGGTIVLARKTYIVGMQGVGVPAIDGYAFAPMPLLEIRGCRLAVRIIGGGARLKCARGLRFGTFDPRGGAATHHPLPYTEGGERAAPYVHMIRVERCSGPVEIAELELDGDASGLLIGGRYGDTGWQLPATGIGLYDNAGPETLRDIVTHRHALDGLIIDGLDAARGVRSTLERVTASDNGRQGCSVVGGRGYDFRDCRFERNGKGPTASAPQAGVDIEAEAGKRIRDLSFADCRFAANGGCGMVADQGDSADVRFERSTFIGCDNWAAWPNKPGFSFANCRFVGPIVHAYGSPVASRAARFTECVFLDDPKLSPAGRVYGGENPSRPIADLPDNRNVIFTRCRFLLTHAHVLPWTTSAVRFVDCTMSQRANVEAYPRGTFLGANSIVGRVVLYSAVIRGRLTVNGRILPPT